MANTVINDLRNAMAWSTGLSDREVVSKVARIVANWSGEDTLRMTMGELRDTYLSILNEIRSEVSEDELS